MKTLDSIARPSFNKPKLKRKKMLLRNRISLLYINRKNKHVITYGTAYPCFMELVHREMNGDSRNPFFPVGTVLGQTYLVFQTSCKIPYH